MYTCTWNYNIISNTAINLLQMYKEMSHKKTIELEKLKAELHLKQKRIEQLQHLEDKDHSKEVSKLILTTCTCIYM